MKRIYAFFAIILSTLLNTAAQSPDYCISNRFSETAYFDSSEIKIDSNILYAVSKNYFTHIMTNLRMDIYYPDMNADSLTLRPFILLIHGGAFLAGNRKDMSYMCMEFARRGFVTATIDYRLGWNCAGTDFFSICLGCGNLNANLRTATYCAVQDARAAMRYIQANAGSYGIDTSYLFTGGESAGAITALHTTFWSPAEAATFAPAAVSQVGLLDTAGNALTNIYSIKAVINSCGAVTKDSIVLNKGNIPVINFADEFDCVVPPGYGQVISCFCTSFYYNAGSAAIYGKLTANGICSEYHQVPANLGHCSFPKPQLIWKASCFLKRVMCNTCQSKFSTLPYSPVSCNTLTGIENTPTPSSGFAFTFTNPVTDELTLSFSKDQYLSMSITITDMLGRSVVSAHRDINQGDVTVKTQNLPAGLYSITVSDGERTANRKLIVISGN